MTKIFSAFVKKEFLHILRDRRTLTILIGMPIILILIFGYTITNEFKDASVAVLDQSKTTTSRQLIHHLAASGHFKLISAMESVKAIEAAFKSGDVKLGIIIPPDFEPGFYKNKQTNLQLLADASEPNYAATLTNYARNMIFDFQMENDAVDDIPYPVHIEMRMLYNPKLIGAYNFIPGVMAMILMLISAMMTSLTIAREKETGTMDLLLVSPLPIMMIILGKVTPYILVSFLNALIVIAMGYYIFKVPIVGSLTLLLILCLLYLLVALSLGVLISTRAQNQQMAMIMSLFILMLPTVMLSGFMFPISSMPRILQLISNVVPAKYFVKIQQAVMLKGAGWEAVMTPTIILVIMMLILIAAARKNFKVVYK